MYIMSFIGLTRMVVEVRCVKITAMSACETGMSDYCPLLTNYVHFFVHLTHRTCRGSALCLNSGIVYWMNRDVGALLVL
jgi:hypothetical protein